jgi:hypothetical protein
MRGPTSTSGDAARLAGGRRAWYLVDAGAAAQALDAGDRRDQQARHHGLGEDFLRQSVQTMQDLEPATLRRLAQTYLDPDKAVVVLAGPGL